MSKSKHQITIYIDENLPEALAHALNLLQEPLNIKNNTQIEVVSIISKFGRGAKDEDWIPEVKNCYVITKDVNINRTKHQRELFLQNDVGMFFLSGKSLDYWLTVKLLVKEWDSILKILKKNSPPFSYKASSKSSFQEW